MLCLFRGMSQKRLHAAKWIASPDRRGSNGYAATWPDRP